MITRHTIVHAAAAALFTAALAGCASSGSSSMANDAPPPMPVQVYTATLSPAEEVPPAADSKGTGTAEVRYDPNTNEISWKVSFSGLTGPATMAHIHGPAAKGSNAGVKVPFPGVANVTSAEGKAPLSRGNFGDLAAGLYYVNVHTAKYPDGEIRGQLMRKQ